MNRNKNATSLNDEVIPHLEKQNATMEKCNDPKLRRLFELEQILVLSDYHMDFYAVAENPALFGYNIECEVCLVDFLNDSYKILPWIDIYAGKAEDGTESNKDMHNGAALDGRSGGIWKDLDLNEYKQQIARGENDLKVYFLSKEDYHICIPETSRLYRETIKQCASLWARQLGNNIPVKNVFFSKKRVSSYESITAFCWDLYHQCQTFDPELASLYGFDTTALKDCRQAGPNSFRSDFMNGEITVAPLTEENKQNLKTLAGDETAQAFINLIEELRGGQTSGN